MISLTKKQIYYTLGLSNAKDHADRAKIYNKKVNNIMRVSSGNVQSLKRCTGRTTKQIIDLLYYMLHTQDTCKFILIFSCNKHSATSIVARIKDLYTKLKDNLNCNVPDINNYSIRSYSIYDNLKCLRGLKDPYVLMDHSVLDIKSTTR